MAQPSGILMEGTAFLSLNNAEDSLKYYAFQYGFQIRREHAKQYAQGPFKGQIKRLVFKCSRAGDHRPRSAVTSGREENPMNRVTINACAGEKGGFIDEDTVNEAMRNDCNARDLGRIPNWQQTPRVMEHFDVFEEWARCVVKGDEKLDCPPNVIAPGELMLTSTNRKGPGRLLQSIMFIIMK